MICHLIVLHAHELQHSTPAVFHGLNAVIAHGGRRVDVAQVLEAVPHLGTYSSRLLLQILCVDVALDEGLGLAPVTVSLLRADSGKDSRVVFLRAIKVPRQFARNTQLAQKVIGRQPRLVNVIRR